MQFQVLQIISRDKLLSLQRINPFLPELLYASCPKGWLYTDNDKSCYKVITNFSGSWVDASEKCKSDGGHLWSVTSSREYNEVLISYNKDISIVTNYAYLNQSDHNRALNAYLPFSSVAAVPLGLRNDHIHGRLVSFLRTEITLLKC